MNVTSAQYVNLLGSTSHIEAVIDGKTMSVPQDPANRHYQAILAWAEEDGNEIQTAE